MPRLRRLHLPGGCYHVMGRGLDRRKIFANTGDKEDFLDRLHQSLSKTQAQCLAWALMPNHYHLLIRIGTEPLGHLMLPLLGGYAGAYNRRHRRSGYVFQNRYKSILCDADSYLLELVRYIHLNPIKANISESIEALDIYPWTGHPALLGKAKRSWQETESVLTLFGDGTLRTLRNRYRKFLTEGMAQGIDDNLMGGGLVRSYGGWDAVKRLRQDHIVRVGDERILGDSKFVERALNEDALQLEKQAMLESIGCSLDSLVAKVCAYCDISPDRLQDKGRDNGLSLAKSLICFWGRDKLGVGTPELMTLLNISQPAVSKSAKRGSLYCLEYGVDIMRVLS